MWNNGRRQAEHLLTGQDGRNQAASWEWPEREGWFLEAQALGVQILDLQVDHGGSRVRTSHR